MIIPDFDRLWEPYGSSGATIEGTRKWLLKVLKDRVSQDVIDSVMAETLLSLASGTTFPTNGCPCGCGFVNAHSAIEHHMRDLALARQQEVDLAQVNILRDNLRTAMLAHIAEENAAFVAEQMTPKILDRMRDGLVRYSKFGWISDAWRKRS